MSNRILSVGSAFPTFTKKAVVSIESGKEFGEITSEDHKNAKKWMVMFWYPKDFTFVCPTEIVEFDAHLEEFTKKNTVLVGASTDSEFSHLGWRMSHPELKGLRIPLLADTSKSLAEELGILTDPEKVAYRATYIVDPNGKIRWVCQNDLDVGRDIPEVLRVLDALQTGKLTPCNWKPGQKTIN
ncbi:MAG: alkyl hydroperoxide reductase [Ignavibacteria bacterium CG_4_8_14_3_um_filter_37_9]|nr:peroxiredoxin [Ignavibacteria bacterium]NCS82290.1 peroxiredoxin [Ignavibacteria bacterium]OIO17110.1 MAG: alkyl hydroperoxide reductase [Ignavibacteria bacterium CG1_02_37_35]PIS44640.1 MAG: alkyl hydroperoxide reductase [Ignavibacteria bacterium CG08_land_8_20_14_0_20_37_9]PIW98940.1 MAG: alkyl hydroperoxide reductase [Ignavibacteria bacterium CG_4_8_14_3_um_filter_37_9]